MSRVKWLGVLLLVSWTLNVALGVALYFRSRDPRPPFHAGIPGEAPPPIGLFPPEERDRVRGAMKPLVREQRRMAEELFCALTADSLDTTLVRVYSDSIGRLRCRMQDLMIDHALAAHGRFPREDREELCRRMIGKLGGEHFGGRGRNREPVDR